MVALSGLHINSSWYEVEDSTSCHFSNSILSNFVWFLLKGSEQKPEGWLYGTNTRTTETGYVPAEFVAFIQEIRPRGVARAPPSNPEGLPTVIEETVNDNAIPPEVPPRR